MTEFEKELVRFVSGYLDAGVSAEDYVKAFSQRLLNSIGKQSKPEVSEEFNEEFHRWLKGEIKEHFGFPSYGEYGLLEVARHFAQWGAEHLKK